MKHRMEDFVRFGFLSSCMAKADASRPKMNLSVSRPKAENVEELGVKPQMAKAALFLTSVGGAAGLAAFGATLMSARREDPSSFNKGMLSSKELPESGVQLATRALKWGSIYAVCGVAAISTGIWFLSGASNLTEFRHKMGSILPKIPKNDPPQSRTEFEGLSDLLTYISTEYSENKTEKKSGDS